VPGGRTDRLTPILWQLTLAGLTLADGSPADHDWLYEWLATPVLVAPDGPEKPPLAVGTPWILRRDHQWIASVKKEAELRDKQSRFPGSRDPIRLLALLGAASIAARLVVDVEPPAEDTGLEFLLHTVDVLTDPRLRNTMSDLAKGHTQDTGVLSLPLAGLAVHMRLRADRVGTCREATVRPDRIVRLIIDRADTVPEETEAAKLYPVASRMIATEWIFNAVSGSAGQSTDQGSNRWFVDQQRRPPARRLLTWIVEQGTSERSGMYSRQQLLLKQLWQSGTLADAADWPTRASDPKSRRIGVQELLLTPVPPVAVWEQNSAILAERATETGAPLTVATQRLTALLSEPQFPDAGLAEAWWSHWCTKVDAVDRPMQLRRDLRRQLVEMFAMPAVDIEAQRLLRLILEKIVDCIVEFSLDTPHDLWSLTKVLKRLPEGAGVGAQTLQVLRARFLHVAGMLDDRRRTTEQMVSPFRAINEAWSRRTRVEIIQSLLHVVASSIAETSDRFGTSLGEIYRSIQDSTTLDRQTTWRLISMTGDADELPDARWLTAVTVDHAEQLARCQLLAYSHGDLPDPASMSRVERDRWIATLGGQQVHVLGMVSAVDDSTVWVGVGVDEPVPVPTTSAWSVGNPVEVTLTSDASGGSLCGRSVGPIAIADRPDEVRRAIVRPRQGTLDQGRLIMVDIVDAHGRTVDGDPRKTVSRDRWAQWVQRWDPDCLMSYSDSRRCTTLARWDAGDQCWYPMDRTATELIAELSRLPEVLSVTLGQPG
jgi:hypothetical protein